MELRESFESGQKLCHVFLWLNLLIVSSSNGFSAAYKSHHCFHLYLVLHLSLCCPGRWDDSRLLTPFLLTSGIWFLLLPLLLVALLPFLTPLFTLSILLSSST